MAKLWGEDYSKFDILRRVGDIRQLAGAQPIELMDGMERGTRAVRLYNAAGLDMTVLTDRGLSIGPLSYEGIQLGLLTPVGAVHPAYSDPVGMDFGNNWPAGFLALCGLTQVGTPGKDGMEELGIHGRAPHLAAGEVRCGGAWAEDNYILWMEGLLRESTLFGRHITLHRRIWTRLDEPRFWIEDTVENRGFVAAPLMILQHFNMGFPLIGPQTHLELPAGKIHARDSAAEPGLGQEQNFSDPIEGYTEQVFYHDLTPDADGNIEVSLANPVLRNGKGLKVTWKYSKAHYPYLVEWKCMRDGVYVVGVEPSNCHVEGRLKEREYGTLEMLAPQATRTFRMEIAFA